MTEISFKADKKHRDRYFTATHFSHPAKMMLPLQRWIIDNYTKSGEVILDPMAGSGTVLIACTMGRHVICVELEEKFVKMQRDNWAKIQVLGPELGYTMGTATILQGDARNLEGLLVDKIISSPPYGELANEKKNTKSNISREERLRRAGHKPKEFMGGIARNASIEDGLRYSHSEENIGNLPYGSIDAVISSPPYEGSIIDGNENFEGLRKIRGNKASQKDKFRAIQFGKETTAYGKVDSIITSPPYESAMEGGSRHTKGGIPERDKAMKRIGALPTASLNNIGNLKTDSYLQAMLLVYQSCHKVLKDGGLMVLVVKPFIRNQKEVKLQEDTKIICAKTGFIFLEEHYRVLTSQSFWRTIYANKYPSAPKLNREYILIFKKG